MKATIKIFRLAEDAQPTISKIEVDSPTGLAKVIRDLNRKGEFYEVILEPVPKDKDFEPVDDFNSWTDTSCSCTFNFFTSGKLEIKLSNFAN